jgi:two-component system chemotaxis response regulator CheB
MWETRQGDVLRFTCQVGHAYSAESMLAGHDAAVEAAMWAALRILEERAELLTRMAHRQHGKARSRFETRAAEAARHALMIRELLASEELEPAGEA